VIAISPRPLDIARKKQTPETRLLAKDLLANGTTVSDANESLSFDELANATLDPLGFGCVPSRFPRLKFCVHDARNRSEILDGERINKSQLNNSIN